jgi:two-component system sensor histidine kinase MprB
VSARIQLARWWRGLDLRRRVALLVAVAVGAAVALTSLAAYLAVRDQLLARVDASLLERARGVTRSPYVDPERLALVPPELLGAADVRILLLGADGITTGAGGAVTTRLLGAPELAVALGRAAESVRTSEVGGQRFRVVAVPAGGGGSALVLAQSTAPTEQVLARLGTVSLLVGATGVALAAWAGLAVARTALRPVERVRAAAERVAQTGRLDPIEVPEGGELGRLAAAFNAMLLALGASQDRQRRLVADAGHELRTPLTSLRTNLDLLAQSERTGGLDPADRAALLGDVRAQVAELSTLVADLVELARDDAPDRPVKVLDLADVVRSALERVRRRAPDLTFSADLRAWRTTGDRQQLERAVLNLLDNAAKWSPRGGVVTVVLRDGELSVCDEGPGIDEADLPHVFDRFWRSPEARAQPGSGLGLAIVAQAAQRHGGSVEAGRAAGGGACLRLRLPAAAAAPAEPSPVLS